MPQQPKRSVVRTPVSTILTPLERSRVDAAAQGLCDPLHRESLDEVMLDLRDQKASLVLISVTKYGSQNSSRVAAMVREFPRIPAVALLTETQNSTPHATLALGQLAVLASWAPIRAGGNSHRCRRRTAGEKRLDIR